MKGKTALITGASAGIGAAFAKAYAGRGANLILTARRTERLTELAHTLKSEFGVNTLVLPGDLSDPAAPVRLLEEISAAGAKVDILVNNAGYGLPGTFLDTSWDDQKVFLQVMLTSPTELCHRVLPGMVDRKWGRIINVASLAGITPGGAGHTLYGPVKAALIKLSESLHAETKATGVHVTALCPGLTYSEFHDVNGQRDRLSDVPKFMWQGADQVVATGVRANERNRPVLVTGVVNKVISVASRVLPGALARELMSVQAKRFQAADE